MFKSTEIIEFDQSKYKALKEVYHAAVQNSVESFTFEGHEYVTSYAKYLIEYLELEDFK